MNNDTIKNNFTYCKVSGCTKKFKHPKSLPRDMRQEHSTNNAQHSVEQNADGAKKAHNIIGSQNEFDDNAVDYNISS